MKGAAAQFRALDGLKVLMKMDRYARPTTVVMGDVEVENDGDANVTFPPHPAKIGTEWTAKIDMGGKKIPISYQLQKVEPFNGKMAAHIIGAFPKGSEATTIKPTRFIVELATGITLRTEGKTRMKIGKAEMDIEYSGGRI